MRSATDGRTLLAVWDSWANVTWGSITRDGGDHWSEPAPLSPEGVSTRYPLAAIALGLDFRVFWTEEAEDGARLGSRIVRGGEM